MSLEQATFDSVGSITLDSRGKIVIGPITGRFIQRRTPPFYSGPFPSATDRYLDHFDTMLEQLRSRDRGLPGRAPLDYLAALELRTLEAGCVEMKQGPWYVKHGHDRGDHYRFDAKDEVVGVVNWEWFVAVPSSTPQSGADVQVLHDLQGGSLCRADVLSHLRL